jgi:hypothetical protein
VNINQFQIYDKKQKEYRNKLLKPFYLEKSHEGRFVFVDKGKIADILQKEYAVDTIMQINHELVKSIEEKIVNWPGYKYTNYTLEIMSCTVPGREKQGWMHYGKCDILLYCFVQENETIEAHAIPFEKLQTWFFNNDNYLKYKSTITEQINHTECKLVLIKDVFDNVPGCKIINIPS